MLKSHQKFCEVVMLVQVERHLFTVDRYHQMIDAGIFTENDRIELIQGDLITMSPIGIRHAACVNKLTHKLSRYLSEQSIISVQNPVQINDISEPEPDVTLLTIRDDYYASNLPTAEDVYLVIEVSDSTLAFDRTIKLPMYAEAGIPEVWLVNLIDNVIEVYREPEAGKYTKRMRVARNEEVTAVSFPNITFSVSDLIS
jgi:Uma2 family endonuclease